MTELTAWYMPGTPRGFWVLRSPAGRLWAFPNVAGAWGKGLRFAVSFTPKADPIPPYLGLYIAHLLGVPGYGPLDDEQMALACWERAEEQRALEAPEGVLA